jgi:hypothetical protein
MEKYMIEKKKNKILNKKILKKMIGKILKLDLIEAF